MARGDAGSGERQSSELRQQQQRPHEGEQQALAGFVRGGMASRFRRSARSQQCEHAVGSERVHEPSAEPEAKPATSGTTQIIQQR